MIILSTLTPVIAKYAFLVLAPFGLGLAYPDDKIEKMTLQQFKQSKGKCSYANTTIKQNTFIK